MQPRPGKTLSHYRLIEKIGEGGMGFVWRAEDTKLHRDVALKFLPESVAKDPERLTRFKREARFLASLNDPNVAAIHEMEEADGELFLVLEYVPGISLADRLKKGSLPIQEALKVCCDLARGLEAAHAKGMIHRDLKPGNVHLTPEGKIKVLDFGLAKAFGSMVSPDERSQQMTVTAATREYTVVGTVPYMSPEQASAKELDKRTDIWSFGCILYELLTGRQTFAGDTVPSTFAAIHAQEPEWERLPVETPVSIRKLLIRCLEKNTNRRLHDIADARIELADAVSDLSTSVAPSDPLSSSSRRQSPPGTRPAWLMPAMMIAALAVVGIFAVVMFRSLEGDAPDSSTDTARPTVSIAVLPFVDLSPDGSQEYFGDGVSEELIHKLVKVPGMRVAGRTSSFSFRGQKLDLRHIGEVLNVDAILEGSVRTSGNSLRITAQLIDAKDGFHLWSDTYNRESKDVFEVQDDLARNVIEALKRELSIDDGEGPTLGSQGTRNQEAYQLYLQARHLFLQRTSTSLRRSIELFEQAIGHDAGFARAHAGLAAAWAVLPGYGGPTEPGDDTWANAETAVRKALELDPHLTEAHAVIGTMHGDWGEWIAGETSLRRALDLEPENPTTLLWFGALLLDEGRIDEAYQRLSQAYEIDPVSGIISGWLGHCYQVLGDHEAAARSLRRAADLGWGPATNWLRIALVEAGEYEQAAKAWGLERERLRLFEDFFDAIEHPTRRPALLSSLTADDRWTWQLWELLLVDETEMALKKLDDVTTKDGGFGQSGIFAIWSPQAADLRRDPRFAEWVKNVGLVDAWNRFGWPEACESVGDGAICR